MIPNMATPVNVLFITAANTLFYCLLCSAPAGHLCMLIFSEIHASRVVHDGTVGVAEQFLGTFKQDGV
jgi:hypothetical protein